MTTKAPLGDFAAGAILSQVADESQLTRGAPTIRRASLGLFLIFCLIVFISSFQTSNNVYGQSPSSDRITSWLQQEHVKIGQRLAGYRQKENEIRGTLLRAQEIHAKALKINDVAAQGIASQAVDTANEALNELKTARELDETNLALVSRALTIHRECSELRAQLERDREALRRQLRASELVREGSSSQPTLIAARTGMAAAHLAILANQFSKYNKLVIEVVSNVEFLRQHAAELSPAVITQPALVEISTAWNGLNAARTAEDCKDQLQRWHTYSHLMENAIAVGKCIKAVEKTAEFISVNGKFLEKAGTVLGIAVPAAEVINEVMDLHKDLKSLADYTESYPHLALQAARRLDERQKDKLGKLAACQVRLGEVFKSLP